jgi:cobyrinic acid a,c-diamide synthase
MSSVPDTARLMIAATGSGAGKTTVTTALIAGLRERGVAVQPFKCGPDYIDPTYHSLAAGRVSRNLDAWMLEESQLVTAFCRASAEADLAIVEGVMGVFDGAGWDSDQGSTAHIARLLHAPVVLVLDISGAARSAAIAVAGCKQLDPDMDLRGVILNNAGSQTHADGCAQAILTLTGVPTLGWLSRDAKLEIPERHLGLLLPKAEESATGNLIADLGKAASERFDLDSLLQIAREAKPLCPTHRPEPVTTTRSTVRPILAVARDEAFSFYYPENLELLEDQGVELEFFSPIRGEAPSNAASGVYFGGGYPELHAPALSANARLWNAVRLLHERDAPIFAECGGFMVLTEGLEDTAGKLWQMAGLVPGRVRMASKLAALGYRRAKSLQPNLLTVPGATLRGHEFHYSRWECSLPLDADTVAWETLGTRPQAKAGSDGFVQGNLLASYLHFHFGQSPLLAQRFAAKLRDHLNERRQA